MCVYVTELLLNGSIDFDEIFSYCKLTIRSFTKKKTLPERLVPIYIKFRQSS